jgi:sec-independent protein translocase protein TatB
MPSFADSAVIFVLALLLFGPKKLPELARYLGKLMGEFRRASSEFRLQMDDEFRAIEQAEQQKKIAAIEAAAPVTPLNIPEPEHPHLPTPMEAETSPEVASEELEIMSSSRPEEQTASPSDPEWRDPRISSSPEAEPVPEPLPIASSGDLHLMPPATGLPVSRPAGSSSLNALFDAIPHTPDPVPVTTPAEPEAPHHG